VDSIQFVSPDSTSGVESATKFYALLDSSTSPSLGFAELVGYQSNYLGVTSKTEVAINSTVLGRYPGFNETWVALSPFGAYSSYPTEGIILFQYRSTYEVNYGAG
jgi:hypothetical protein